MDTVLILGFELNFNFHNMVVRNEDNVSVCIVFSPNHVDKIHKMHTLVQFVFSFFHPFYSTSFNSIILSAMILHKRYLSKCQNEQTYP